VSNIAQFLSQTEGGRQALSLAQFFLAVGFNLYNTLRMQRVWRPTCELECGDNSQVACVFFERFPSPVLGDHLEDQFAQFVVRDLRRLGPPAPEDQFQSTLNLTRCQRTTVSGRSMRGAGLHSRPGPLAEGKAADAYSNSGKQAMKEIEVAHSNGAYQNKTACVPRPGT
jgi:hypothetical protein